MNNCCCGNGSVFAYPYNRPARDSYGFCPCPPPGPRPYPDRHPGPKPDPNHFPTSGSFVGNGFSLVNTYPYIIDTTMVEYGQILSYANAVRTDIAQRRDPSCINLEGTIDLTNTDLNNMVLNDFLVKYISQKYAVLDGVLPIMKGHLKMELDYTITDINGGVMHTATLNQTLDQIRFHYTDIRDMFVTSAGGIIIANIPAMTYAGLYTLTINAVRMYVPIVDTSKYLENGLNPFYQFTDNNLKIVLQHDLIENTEPDDFVLISETPVNISFDYQANVTNRLRFSFVTFMSNFIAAPNTLGVYEALYTPTDEIITQLRQEVSTLQESVHLLNEALAAANTRIDTLEGRVTVDEANIADLTTRIKALEDKPDALAFYTNGRALKSAQLTYPTFGTLYQCMKDFTASGDVAADVLAGNIIPVTPAEEG